MNQVVNRDSDGDRGPDRGCKVGNEGFFGSCNETKKRENYLLKNELVDLIFSI